MSIRTDSQNVDDNGKSFGEVHFGSAELGDTRRTKRLVKIADQIARHPGGTLPDKIKSPGDLESLYHFMNSKNVTHQGILKSHFERTKRLTEACDGYVVYAHDITELDFSGLDSIEEMGFVGNGTTKGWLCFNVLAIDSQKREVLGLANQILHTRPKVDKDETDKEKRNRGDRETRLWVEGSKPLPVLRKIVDVCDRGADTFEFLSHEAESGRTFVIRSSHDRVALSGHEGEGRRQGIHTHVRTCPALGSWTMQVAAARIKKTIQKKRHGKKISRSVVVNRLGRDVVLRASATPLRVCPPVRERGIYQKMPIAVWVVRVWEDSPPDGVEPVEWILLTNHPVSTLDDAKQVVSWYQCRWIIEEYHKAMKTGCGIENPQFTRQRSLHAMIAILSVVAISLLNLRATARSPEAHTRKATGIISSDYVRLLSAWRHRGKTNENWTIHEFHMALARLGGHQNRKCDGAPGWLVLWRGWMQLQAMMDGARALGRIA